MADKDKDEDKFEDDEDFGLPELHYEELDDDADSSSKNEDKSEDEDKEEIKSDEQASDPFAKDSASDSSEDSFYEEESFDEFKEDASATSSVFDSDDTSPEDSYKETSTESGFGSDSYRPSAAPEPFTAYYDDDTSKRARSNFTKIVIIGILLFASIAIVFMFVMDGDDLLGLGGDEKVVAEPEPVVEETVVDSSAFAPVDSEPVDPQANQLTPGEITTLEQRTGKSYVVIGSFFDGDLAMDYAKKLAENGNSPQIIPPFKDYRFHRVAIAEFDTFKDAEAQAPSYGEQFGREAWPLKY